MRDGSTPGIFTTRGFYRTRTRLQQAIASVLRAAPATRVRAAAARIEPLEARQLLANTFEITEVLASNQSTLADVDGEYTDWIEIHNAGASPANLNGYYLTDDAARPRQWVFPNVALNADQYLVVFASGKNRRVAGQQLHTSFNLSAAGEYLALVEPDGTTIASQITLPAQEPDISYGADPNAGGTARYFAKPSPGARNARAEIVINELHYHPDIDTELTEFIELYNPGSAPVDLAGAYFSSGVTYTFPAGATLAANAYLLLVQDLPDFQVQFPGKTPFGQYVGGLTNDGETVTLRNKSGGMLDEVDYQLGFPWPTVGDPPGYSIELVNPDFDNSLGGNWRSVVPSQPAQDLPALFSEAGAWSYRRGDSEASTPKEAWRASSFIEDGTTWKPGTGPIGYDGGTVFSGSPLLSNMNGNYSSFFMRKTFNVTNLAQIGSLRLEAMYDDGFVVWINGNWVYTQAVGSNNPAVTDTATGTARESNVFDKFNLPANAISYLKTGIDANVIAVQVFNIQKSGSSDAFFDARLIPSTTPAGGSSPTPAAKNTVYATNVGPQMRQVVHTPQQPTSNQTVTITAKVTDPEGVKSVDLEYQIVDPGSYIPTTTVNGTTGALTTNPQYLLNWIKLAMKDDGAAGDMAAGDGIYTVQIPANIQTHRRLIRYRITAVDNQSASVTAPYADDPVPNFAYYVYNGIPTWTAADRPGVTQSQTYDFSQMPQIPVFQLLTTAADHQDAQHIPTATTGGYTGDLYKWTGTFVYDGVVYDNIHYRARGGVWRYAMGKNMWKFDFNRGHEFQARDEYGNLLAAKWTKINLGANIQQGNFLQRGEQGLFEHVGFELFNLAGAPSSKTVPIHFRIVERASETNGTSSQYDDDFQGMYLAVEQPDGRLLQEHGLPDGNLYKMENGTGELNNQGPTQPDNKADLNALQLALGANFATTTDQWIRDNINLEAYYAYRFVVDAIHHYDIGFSKNYFWYHNPVTNKWQQAAWDLDLTWTTTYQEPPGGGDSDPFRVILNRPAFQIEYKNYGRELRDLLYNTDQTGQLLDEYANLVDTPVNGLSMADADRAMWDYNPILISSLINSSKAGQGKFYESVADRTFRGMVTKLKNWVTNTRGPWMDAQVADTLIPLQPTLTRLGAATYPINDLRFRSSNFSDGTGSFAAMKWRIAQVKQTNVYEINALWESPEITTFNSDITIPPNGVFDGQSYALQVGKTYRVRVKMKDNTGRWSKWSNPIEFVASAAAGAAVKDSLRITELHYNPDAPPPESPYTGEDFEFIELKNTGAQPINLLNSAFTAGVTFTFPDLTLNPGQHVLVVRNQPAFESRYGNTGFTIAGTYTGGLSNGGEQVKLVDSAALTILDFTYSDLWYPNTDGGGESLVIVNENAPIADWNLSTNWRASRINDGTPGVDETTLPDGAVIINEALTHTDLPLGDWIELRNTTDQPIDLSGWFLADSHDVLKQYRIADGATIPANGYLVFTQTQHFGAAFGLSELGETIVLSSANAAGLLTGYRDAQDFGAAKKEVPFGQYIKSTGGTDFVAMKTATPGQPNSAPLFGPVVINELMYAPAAGGDEFIELSNASDTTVALYDPLRPNNTWKFIEGVTYAFPPSTTLGPRRFALVVGIDPAAFQTKYNIPADVEIFGPFTGVLDDAGESVALAAPADPEPDNSVPYYVIDRVNYKSVAPWPTAPNGTGPSLARLIPDDYGNDVANWASGGIGGTPGRSNFDAIPPQVSSINVPATAVSSITIVFSEPVRNFDRDDLTLTRNAGLNLLTAAQTLTTTDNITWTLGNLADLTSVQGDYQLTLTAAGSGIIDYGGNALVNGASTSFTIDSTTIPGTSGDDTFYLIQSGQNLNVFRNIAPGPTPTLVLPLAQFTNLVITAGSGNDTLTLDFAGGDFVRTGELVFLTNTSDSNDLLRVVGNGTYHMEYAPFQFPGENAVRTTSGWVRFAATVPLNASNYPSFGLSTPQGNGRITADTTQPASTRFTGTTGGQFIAPLTLSNIGSFTLAATTLTIAPSGMGDGASMLKLSPTPSPITLNLNGGSYDLNANFNINDNALLNLNLNGSAALSIPATRNLASLSLAGSSRLTLTSATAAVLRTGTINISDQAVLDLNNNALVVNAGANAPTALLQVTDLVRRAYVNNANRWTGPGITSTAAKNNGLLGLAPLANRKDESGARFDPNEDVNAILVKVTYNGDVNVDGAINLNDYTIIDWGYLNKLPGYANGDVNYDGAININDYFMIDSAYLGQPGPLFATTPLASVASPGEDPAIIVQTRPAKARRDRKSALRRKVRAARKPAPRPG